MAVYIEAPDESRRRRRRRSEAEVSGMPPLEAGQRLGLVRLDPKQHFTQPPPRYTEASLVKELEEKGIGRPSTYAQILTTIQDREYVQRDRGTLSPTELGETVTDLLLKAFPDIIEVEFTAQMEESLDEIEEGDRKWVETVREFYKPFAADLKQAGIDDGGPQEGQAHRRDLPRRAARASCSRSGGASAGSWRASATRTASTRGTSGTAPRRSPSRPAITCDKCGKPMVYQAEPLRPVHRRARDTPSARTSSRSRSASRARRRAAAAS